ncbi:MAG: inverse autotransporter beta domain-containing protein, partial [Hyphomicrobiales bacterium]|nr:inverse autotransporter beta domain-containing protein [Hyphomicrobiales bacterium]
LNLRETGSQIVVETIENALRQGGLALLGEGFQLDSSLSYHSGDNEGIEGDLDVVIPLWNGGRHAIFTQPGFVFWKGLEGEERFDGNIGLVYRAELTRGLIAGASIFYDQDFEIGHSRVSGGLDLQSGFFRFGANYYHPLSEIEDGREGFVEEALTGMDARLVFEREAVRLGSTIGYWDYKGEESGGQEDSRSGWKTSIGLDFGVRILPGVFAEASWERHKDNIVLDERIFAGLAFRFSLPDFEGASYGSGEMTSNLYKIVDREKRILYEERQADNIILTPSGSVVEGGTVTVAIQLREPSAEDVVINLVGSGTATYGTDGDYTVSVGGTNCTAVTGTSCQVTVTAGQTEPADNVVITINPDGGGENPETIVLSTTIASGDASLTSRPLVLTIPVDPPLPLVSLSADSTSILEGNTATITLTLSERLGSDATFNLIGVGATADVTYGASNDWNLDVGGTNCDMASESNPCQVTISQGNTTAEVVVEANVDIAEPAEDFTVSVVVDSGSIALVTPGSSSSLDFTIEGAPTVSLNYSGTTTLPTTLGIVRALIELSEPIRDSAVTVNIVGTGSSATYDSNEASGTWAVFHKAVPEGMQPPAAFTSGTACPSVTAPNGCEITIAAGQTYVDLELTSSFISSGNNIVFTLGVASASENLVRLGSSFTHTLTTE